MKKEIQKGKGNLPEKFVKVVEGKIHPTPVDERQIKVTISTLGNFTNFVKYDYQAITAKMQSIGASVSFTEDEYILYCRACVHSRVNWVNGVKVIVHPMDDIAIPAFVNLLLTSIGRAEDREIGAYLIPEMVGGDRIPDRITKQWMFAMSMKIKSIPGLDYSQGYTKYKDGAYDFMVMQYQNDKVYADSAKYHPVYSLLAFVTENAMTSTLLPKNVKYASKAHMDALLWGVISV